MEKVQSTIDLLAKLVSFDTTSRNSNLEIVSYIEDFLAQYGVQSQRIYDETGLKANLLATIGPEDQAGYVLSGHTDVVPVDGQSWSGNPFEADVRNNRMYGRGTTDMKGFLALVLAKVPDMTRASLKKPFHLAFSYDEELGMQGAPSLIDEIGKRPVRPEACFVGEPTEMEVVIGHKGKNAVRVEVTGKSAHSSLAPHAVNAVEYAALVIAKIREIAGGLANGNVRDELYNIPFTTGQTALVQGGVHLSTIPDQCAFEFEFRTIPADDGNALVEEVKAYARDTLEPEMKAIEPETGFSFRTKFAYPGLETAPDSPVCLLAKKCSGRSDHAKVAYGAEAGMFSVRGGIPSVICGPGSIAQAHKPDEYIAISELEKGGEFVTRLIDHACTAGSH